MTSTTPQQSRLDRKSQPAIPSWLRTAAFVVVCVGIVLRLVNLDNKPFWWDETLTLLWCAGYATEELYQELPPAPSIITANQILRFQRANPERGIAELMRPMREDALHPPVFFVLAHLWQRHVGDSMAAMRLLPALFGVISLLAMGWLCREMFGCSTAAWLATSFLAISPLQLAYAQELKQYSLWTALVLITCALLLRALRSRSYGPWICFAVAAILALHTHLLTASLLLGLGSFVIVRERFKPSRATRGVLISGTAIGLATLPWLAVLVEGRGVRGRTWLDMEQPPLGSLLGEWIENLGRIAFDLSNLAQSASAMAASGVAAAVLALLCLYSLLLLAWHDRRNAGLVLALSVPGAAILVGWDLLEGGIRSTAARFLMPSYLGLQIALAYLFWQRLRLSGTTRILWTLGLIGLWGIGILSCWANARSSDLWSKPQSGAIREASQLFNARPDPLVLYWRLPVLSLAWELDADVKLMQLDRHWQPEMLERFKDSGEVYAYAVPKVIAASLSQRVELVPVQPMVKRLAPRE